MIRHKDVPRFLRPGWVPLWRFWKRIDLAMGLW